MTISPFPKTKNSQTAWLLALVLFFSGLSYSSPSYARAARVKAGTELVLSPRNNSAKTFKWFSLSQQTEQISSAYNHSTGLCSLLSKVKFKETNETHQQFSSTLMMSSFLSQQRASLAHLV